MRSIVDPTTGGRRSASINTFLRTNDGRLIQREPIYACRTCGQQPLSEHAVRACHRCRNIVCATCTTSIDDLPYCPACGAVEQRSRLWRFLFSIE
jgi:predicted SprT family Zn-dependent metalloprotease